MKLTTDVMTAGSISVAACDLETCNCGCVHVRLHDATDRVFATGSVSPHVAVELAADIMDEAEHMLVRRTRTAPECQRRH